MRNKKPSILVRIFAAIRGGDVVWLEDHRGRVYESIATKSAFGVIECNVFWFTKVGHCILIDGGKIGINSQSSYIEKWKFAKEA